MFSHNFHITITILSHKSIIIITMKEANTTGNLERNGIMNIYKEMEKENYLNRYKKLVFTENQIYGFPYESNVYIYITKNEYFDYYLNKSTKNGSTTLDWRPTKKSIERMLKKATILCTVEEFEQNYCYSNNGKTLEKMLFTKLLNQTYVPDTVRFDEGADITINNVPYSVKYLRGRLSDMKTIETAENEK